MNIFARSTPSMCIFSALHCHFSFYVTQICRITLFSFRLYLAIATHFDTFLLLSEGNEILIYTPFLMTKNRFWNIIFFLRSRWCGYRVHRRLKHSKFEMYVHVQWLEHSKIEIFNDWKRIRLFMHNVSSFIYAAQTVQVLNSQTF